MVRLIIESIKTGLKNHLQFTLITQPIRTAERKAPSITKHIWRRTKQNKTGDDLKIKLATNAKTCPVRRILVNLVNMTN